MLFSFLFFSIALTSLSIVLSDSPITRMSISGQVSRIFSWNSVA